MQTLISIIVPAYNAAQYIGDTIRSVQTQIFQNWELIIVNDGSTDDTIAAVNAFSADTRIKCITQKNEGVSAARNTGIDSAKGDFIGFLDADDTMLENNLTIKLEQLINSKEFDFVFSDVLECNDKLEHSGMIIKGVNENILEKILLWEGAAIPLPAGNIIAKKKCFESGLRFDTALSTAADQDFAIRLAAHFKGKHIAAATVCYRILPNSMSRNIAVMEKDHIAVFEKAEKNNLFRSFTFKRQCFSNLYLILAGSWWVNGKNKKRALFFMWKSIINRPRNIFKLLKKVF